MTHRHPDDDAWREQMAHDRKRYEGACRRAETNLARAHAAEAANAKVSMEVEALRTEVEALRTEVDDQNETIEALRYGDDL